MKFGHESLKMLHAQMDVLERHHIDPEHTPVCTKFRLLQRLLQYVSIYNFCFVIQPALGRGFNWATNISTFFFDFGSWAVLSYLFRCRTFVHSVNAGQVDELARDVAQAMHLVENRRKKSGVVFVLNPNDVTALGEPLAALQQPPVPTQASAQRKKSVSSRVLGRVAAQR